MKNKLIRVCFVGVAVMLLQSGVAATRTIEVANVTQLTNAFYTAQKSDEIVLAKGTYDLTELAVSSNLMRAASSTSYSQPGAILWLSKAKMTLRGATGKPEDVTIKVDYDQNPGYRILATSENAKIRDLSITGGKSTGKYCGAWNFRGGGAISMYASGIVISNCVFYGNTSPRHGGAVSGLNSRYGTVIDCVFYGNNGECGSGSGGLAGGYSTFIHCMFSNNVTSASLGTSDVGVVVNSIVTNCTIINNRTSDGALNNCTATDCRIINNYAISTSYNGAQGGGAQNSTCTECYFYGNSSYRGGGAGYGGNFYDCEIISNECRYGNYDCAGGGIYGATEVVGCHIISNSAGNASGGGVAACAFVSNCVIRYNAARLGDLAEHPNNGGGGGAYNSTCYKCEFTGNLTLGGLNGGAMCGGSAYNCIFRDNAASAITYVDNLVGCDIGSSGGIRVSNMVNCVVHDCDNRTNVVRAVNNVARPNGCDMNHYMYALQGQSSAMTVRGCLFTNNVHAMLYGWQVNAAMFHPGSASHIDVENCTFADNVMYFLTRYFEKTATISFVNTALVRNRTGVSEVKYKDVRSLDYALGNVALTNCVTTSATSGSTNYNCVVVANPRFVGEGDHPYTPKFTSPLATNKGIMLDWMADAVDLAGNPRVREGKVCIGCYACWLKPRGFLMFVK